MQNLSLEDGKYLCGSEVEKMSKSKYNVVNPDDIIERYGADTLRLYEMFLGPLEQFKPWNTNGIDGVFKFLKKGLGIYIIMHQVNLRFPMLLPAKKNSKPCTRLSRSWKKTWPIFPSILRFPAL
jgi:leucyl-tRNA synthetase